MYMAISIAIYSWPKVINGGQTYCSNLTESRLL